jgi:alpha-1,2-mannosyltransferase
LCRYSVAVNSSWTKGHIAALWGREPAVVYPPCDTAALREMPLARGVGGGGSDSGGAETGAKSGKGAKGKGTSAGVGGGDGAAAYVLSVGQFRPEKDHPLQLRAWAAVKKSAAAAEAEATSKMKTKTKAGAAAAAARAMRVLAARLKIVGGCRGAADQARLAGLRALATELGVDDSVVGGLYKLNAVAPYVESAWFGDSTLAPIT